jgi:hypothetical protein
LIVADFRTGKLAVRGAYLRHARNADHGRI